MENKREAAIIAAAGVSLAAEKESSKSKQVDEKSKEKDNVGSRPQKSPKAFAPKTSESSKEKNDTKDTQAKQSENKKDKPPKKNNTNGNGKQNKNKSNSNQGPSVEDEETLQQIRELEKKVESNLDDLLGSDRKDLAKDLNESELDALLKNV